MAVWPGPAPAAESARATRYLDAAIQTGRWLASAAIDTPLGSAWPIVAGQADTISATLYGSGAGVAIYLADLAVITGEADLANAARGASRFVARSPDEGRHGLYSGYAGMALAVAHVGEVLGDEDLVAQGEGMVDLRRRRPPAGRGLEWPPWPNGRGPWSEL